MTALLELAGAAVTVGGRAVFSDLSIRVDAGERVVLLGVNGCGKTTLLRALDGLVFASRGEVRYAGTRLAP